MFTNETFKKLMDDQEFVIKMMSQENPEAVQKLLVENGVDASMEDVMTLAKALENAADHEGELNEDALDEVAGGVLVEAATVWAVVKCATAVGAMGLAIYKWYKSR